MGSCSIKQEIWLGNTYSDQVPDNIPKIIYECKVPKWSDFSLIRYLLLDNFQGFMIRMVNPWWPENQEINSIGPMFCALQDLFIFLCFCFGKSTKTILPKLSFHPALEQYRKSWQSSGLSSKHSRRCPSGCLCRICWYCPIHRFTSRCLGGPTRGWSMGTLINKKQSFIKLEIAQDRP